MFFFPHKPSHLCIKPSEWTTLDGGRAVDLQVIVESASAIKPIDELLLPIKVATSEPVPCSPHVVLPFSNEGSSEEPCTPRLTQVCGLTEKPCDDTMTSTPHKETMAAVLTWEGTSRTPFQVSWAKSRLRLLGFSDAEVDELSVIAPPSSSNPSDVAINVTRNESTPFSDVWSYALTRFM